MPRILNEVLGALRRIYGVPGQLQAPSDIEYAGPIQLIHDVSKQAEVARGGEIVIRTALVHAAADRQRDVILGLMQLAVDRGIVPVGEEDQFDIWITGGHLESSIVSGIGNTDAAMGITDQGTEARDGGTFLILVGSDGSLGQELVSGSSFAFPMHDAVGLPYLIATPQNGSTAIRLSALSSAASTTTWGVRLWVGVKGSVPPTTPLYFG